MVTTMNNLLIVSIGCMISLVCTSNSAIKQDVNRATLISVGGVKDGGTQCITIRYRKSIIKCCIDGRAGSEFRGRLFTKYPTGRGARLVNKGDTKIIEAILHLDPKDAHIEVSKTGPYNIIDVLQEKVREIVESHH